MKNAFNGLISRLDRAEERTSELEVSSTELPELKNKQNKDRKNKTEYQVPWDNCNRWNPHEWEYQKKERKEQKKYVKQQWLRMSPNKCHTPNRRSGKLSSTKQDKCSLNYSFQWCFPWCVKHLAFIVLVLLLFSPWILDKRDVQKNIHVMASSGHL